MSDRLLRHLRERFPDAAESFDPLDYVYAKGSVEDALWYSHLIWPKFVRVRDLIILQSAYITESDRNKLNNLFNQCEDNRAVEIEMNRFPIHSMFLNVSDTPELYMDLLDILVESWRCKLEREFKDIKFNVYVEDSDNYDDISIVFHQI